MVVALTPAAMQASPESAGLCTVRIPLTCLISGTSSCLPAPSTAQPATWVLSPRWVLFSHVESILKVKCVQGKETLANYGGIILYSACTVYT